MLKFHEELLQQIEAAEKLARKLYAKGAKIDETIRLLKLSKNEISERIRHYKAEAQASPSPAEKPKALEPATVE